MIWKKLQRAEAERQTIANSHGERKLFSNLNAYQSKKGTQKKNLLVFFLLLKIVN